MMRNKISTLFTVICLTVISFPVNAQIPNHGFEKWDKGSPSGWWINNKPVFHFSPVVKTKDAYSGKSAVKGTVSPMGKSMSFAPVIHTGTVKNNKISISKKYSGISGYYKFSPVKKDQLVAAVFMYKDGKQIGKGMKYFQSADKYDRFEVKINYTSDEVPDKCEISFTVFPGFGGKDQLKVHKGSVMYLDDISFIK